MEHPSEHVEHIEHQQHAAHNPFDRMVAMTMAIVAAGLACVTMLSHRAHNETLQHQIEASVLQGKATDGWGFFQAKNIRRHEYEAYVFMSKQMAKEPGQEEAAKDSQKFWKKKVNDYKIECAKLQKEAEDLEKEVKHNQEESHHAHAKSTRFDLAELGIELALVLCSVAILTKQRGFWYVGMAAGVAGAAVAVTGFFVG